MIKRLQYSVLPEAALGLLFAVLAFFAVFASYDIDRRADKSKLVKSSELAFSTSRYLLDFMELEMAARRAGLQDASLRDGMLKLRYDIALGRMDLLNSGELKQETDKAIRRRIDAATKKFAGIVEAMNDGGCDTACRSARIAEIVPSIRRELAFLQTEGFKRDSNLRGMMQKSIGASVTWMTQLSWAVLASAAVFVLFTLVRYRMLLRRTYALRKSRDELRVISKYRANFMAGMSHEFRTPLNAIKGFSEFGAVIVQDAKPEKLKEYFGYIHDAAANLEQLTNTLLDLSKIDAGIFKLNREDVDLGDLLSGVVREINAATGTPGRIAIDNACDGTLDCDPSTVHRCVSNLISNAIKYSPADSPIRISTRVEGGMVAIAVRDHGRGIPADELEEVWSLYSRSSYFRGDEIEGTGLGLTITRALVETHGGEVRIESEVGSGTTVTLCFPADERLVPTAARPYSPEVEAA